MKIPSNSDWGEINQDDLDADWAYKTFFGKSFDEAVAMFQENALRYQEDLQSMPAAAFNFYAPGLVKYIISPQAAGDSDGASSFLHMVAWMIKTQQKIILPETERLLLGAAEQVSRNQTFYEADTDIYGEFPEVYAEIKDHAKHRS
ncbi:MAG: hypothetical protein ACSLE2_08200 [Lysobacterales bacterium]